MRVILIALLFSTVTSAQATETLAFWPKLGKALITPAQSVDITFAPIDLDKNQWGELCNNNPNGSKVFLPNSVKVMIGTELYYVTQTSCMTSINHSSTFFISAKHSLFDSQVVFEFNTNADQSSEAFLLLGAGNSRPLIISSTY